MSLHGHSISRRSVVIGAAGIGIASTMRPVFAQDGSPEASPGGEEGGPGMPPLPPGAVVVAEGLWNPGDLAVGDDGTLYIAEGGIFGGEESEGPPASPDPNASPVASPPPLIPPQVSQVTADGAQSVLTTETGGVGIGVTGGTIYVSTGGGSVGSGMIPLPQENTVTSIDVATGAVTLVASLGQYEVDNNPDGTDVNPNLYGLAIDASGAVFVADAGGNTIYKIDPASGEFTLFAVVPNLTDLTGATPTAEEEAMQPGPRQPVPTSIVIDDAGMLHVTLLSEGWSGPSVLVYSPDGTYTAGISGVPMVVNAALGPDGLLYLSQLTADFAGEQPAPGTVFRITADGAAEAVVEGLFFPHGIAFDAAGNLFVATNSIISSPDAPLGMVIRIDGIAAPA